MNDEFKEFGKELNNSIPEFKEIKAIEYYAPKEAVVPAGEIALVREDSSDESEKKDPEQQQSAKDKMAEQKERLDRVDKFRNTDNTGLQEIEAESAASTTTTAATTTSSAASTTSSIVSTASLTTGLTVISAAAVIATGGIGGAVFAPKPTINSASFETGSDYLVYELDVDVPENYNYKIKVSNDSFSETYPIEVSGVQRRIVSGLIPDRAYDVEIICTDGNFITRTFYSHKCYTDKIKMPAAVFNFSPVLDYEEGIYSISYEVFLSDYYDKAADTFLQIYESNEMVVETYELEDDNYFRGELFNLGNNTELSAIAYTTYQGEVVEIGTYGYICEYPEDFISIDTKQVSTFDLNSDSVTYECDITKGNEITVNTGFDNTKDKRELYRLDVYNGQELVESIESQEPTVTFTLAPAIVNVKMVLTPIKRIDGKDREFEPIEEKYSVDPGLFSSKEFRTYESGYYFELEYAGEVLQNPFDVEVTKNYSDGTSDKDTDTFEGSYGNEGSFIDHTLVDVESIHAVVKYGDIVVFDYTYIPNQEVATFDSFEIDDNGGILLPYEITLPEDATLDYIYLNFFDGTSQSFELSELKGILAIAELNSNVLEGEFIVGYKTRDGVSTEASVKPEKIDIGASVETTYYISHSNSYYNYVNLRFKTTLNGQDINIKLVPYLSNGDSDEYTMLDLENTRMYGDYYSINVSSSIIEETDPDTGETSYKSNYFIKYKLEATGFETDPTEINVAFGISDSGYSEYDSNINAYSAGHTGDGSYVEYIKEENNDGTSNYYFDTGLVSESGKHYGRIEYSYEENGVKHYYYSDFYQGKTITLNNLPDKDYSFKYAVYYLSSYGDYYDTTITASYGSDVSYVGREVSAESAVDISNATIFVDEESSCVTFDIDTDYLINTEPIKVTIGGSQYEIAYLSEGDDGVEQYEDGYTYTKSSDDYVYNVIVIDNKFSVELAVHGEYERATINLTSVPSRVLTSFSSLDSSKYQKEITVNVGEYTGVYDESKFSVSQSTGGSGERNVIYIDISSFKVTDSQDKLLIEAYSDGILVASNLVSSNTSQAEIEVDPGYTKLTLKITEQKVQSINARIFDTRLETYTISYNTIELPDEVLFDEQAVISDISVNVSDNSYLISVSADSFEDYVIEARQVYKDGTKSDLYIGEKGQTSYNKNEDVDYTNISYIEVRISEVPEYSYENIARSVYKIYLTPEITDFTYTDNDEIVIPYTYSAGDMTIDTSESEVVVGNDTFSYGEDLVLGSIESKDVSMQFNIVAHTDSGVAVSYSFNHTYELSANRFELDYTVSTYNTSYYENGYSFGGAVYKVNATVQPYLGIYAINDTNFEMNVTKSGSPLVDAPPTVLVTDLVVSGDKLVGTSYSIFAYDNNGTYSIEYNINGIGDTITFGALTTDESYASEFTASIRNATIERSTTNGVLSLLVSTEFDATQYENGYYVIYLLDADDSVIAKSGNLTTADYTFEYLPKDFYKIKVTTYRVIDGTTYQSYSSTNTIRDYLDEVYVYEDSVRLEMSNDAFSEVGSTVSVTIDGVTYTTDTSGNPLTVGAEATYELADGITMNYYTSYRTIVVNISNYDSLTITLINSNGGDNVEYVIK